MFNKPKQDIKQDGGHTESQDVTTEGLKQALTDCPDIIFSDINVNANRKLNFTVAFVDGMVRAEMADNFILKPLIQEKALGETWSEQSLIELILHGTVYHGQRILRTSLSICLSDLLSGSVLLVFDETKQAVTFELKGFEKRAITEPTNENVLKGSKESFIEVLRVNTALVRRRIKTSALKNYELTLGTRSKTTISIIYLEGVANKNTVEEVKRRLNNSKYDGIISAGQIEGFLLDNAHSFFPQVLYTERVDKFCGNILEGRVGIIIDGMPLCYIVPIDINSLLQAPEDYSLNYIVSSFFRLLRHVCAFAALILPAVYVAMTTFHQDMLPSELVVSIVVSKQGVPFPTFVEVILMLVAFEILLEAGLRLPKSVGQAVSIVGAVVIGQAAITAKILSPGVVIVIAAAGIAGFVVPSQDLSNSIRICRLLLVASSVISGLFGVVVGLIVMLYHLCNLEVFDTPYMAPYVANEGEGMIDDTFVRKAWFNLKKRPKNIGTEDDVRQGS